MNNIVTSMVAVTVAFGVWSGIGLIDPNHAAAEVFPVAQDALAAVATGLSRPDVSPPGSNRPDCRSSAHPNPVVLVHGTALNQNANWQAVAPMLANNGYCVFSVTVGRTPYSGGSGDVDSMYNSADQLAVFVDQVLGWTGAQQVDLIGHSQGGAIQRIYVERHPSKVHRVVGLAAANSGVTTSSGLKPLLDALPPLRAIVFAGCPACAELNNPSTYRPIVPDVLYHNIIGVTDEIITPYTVGFLPPAANVVNQTVQSVCPNDNVGHIGIVYDPAVIQMTMNALDPEHPEPVNCAVGLPV